ncbi:hypothetical protein FOZ63_005575 [Perkinsus olseni]|uniref:Uncharacterized protein n=1 Tax=Perkinsus olseni TaxID=32597 RepID=A0A7J6RP38_PEROL|nr:hypothetical protein FOZ63_005575 [Perkinsus olseni]KAF4722215.1 hypothetical protein FOZ62_022328 [Perkinsus olseni]
MMNFVSTWLLFAQALVISTAQDVGRFAYEESFSNMYYDVNENKEVTLTIDVPEARQRRGDIPKGAHRAFGPYPLRKEEGFTYTIDFEKSGITSDDWYESLDIFLSNSGVIKPGEPFDHEGDQPPPLATLHYSSGDGFSVNMGAREIYCSRVGRDLLPGKYVYKDPFRPRVKIIYKIRNNGVVRLWVRCEKRTPSRFRFILSLSDHGVPPLHYHVQSAGRSSLNDVLNQVRRVCPSKHLSSDDFSKVVFATEKTIYIEFEGNRLPLTKV